MAWWYYANDLGARIISWNVSGHEHGIRTFFSWLFG
jgi:hypothetical protein